MRDDLSAPNLGQSNRLFEAEFFWKSHRIIEQWMTRVLTKGPVNATRITAEEITTTTVTAETVTAETVSVETVNVDDLVIDGVPVEDILDLYVEKAGDTMTGPLTLPGAPSANLHAATKKYVDDTTSSAPYIRNDVAQTATGPLTLTSGLNSASILPLTTAAYNLGSTSLRWNTVYTSDLSLSNGIGDWTIVEGEDDLFIYNNRKDKVYRFALVEVDASEAPPKKE